MKPPTDTYLSIRREDGTIEPWPLKHGRVVIGRYQDADLRVDHVTVSRRHAEIFPDPFGR